MLAGLVRGVGEARQDQLIRLDKDTDPGLSGLEDSTPGVLNQLVFFSRALKLCGQQLEHFAVS